MTNENQTPEPNTFALSVIETLELTQALGANPFPPGTTIETLFDAILPIVEGLDTEKLKRVCPYCFVGHYLRVRREMAEGQKGN